MLYVIPPINAADVSPNNIRGAPEVVESLNHSVGPPDSPPIVNSYELLLTPVDMCPFEWMRSLSYPPV